MEAIDTTTCKDCKWGMKHFERFTIVDHSRILPVIVDSGIRPAIRCVRFPAEEIKRPHDSCGENEVKP